MSSEVMVSREDVDRLYKIAFGRAFEKRAQYTVPGLVGGAALGAILSAVTPRDEDESRWGRILRYLAEGAALGGIAGFGADQLGLSSSGSGGSSSEDAGQALDRSIPNWVHHSYGQDTIPDGERNLFWSNVAATGAVPGAVHGAVAQRVANFVDRAITNRRIRGSARDLGVPEGQIPELARQAVNIQQGRGPQAAKNMEMLRTADRIAPPPGGTAPRVVPGTKTPGTTSLTPAGQTAARDTAAEALRLDARSPFKVTPAGRDAVKNTIDIINKWRASGSTDVNSLLAQWSAEAAKTNARVLPPPKSPQELNTLLGNATRKGGRMVIGDFLNSSGDLSYAPTTRANPGSINPRGISVKTPPILQAWGDAYSNGRISLPPPSNMAELQKVLATVRSGGSLLTDAGGLVYTPNASYTPNPTFVSTTAATTAPDTASPGDLSAAQKLLRAAERSKNPGFWRRFLTGNTEGMDSRLGRNAVRFGLPGAFAGGEALLNAIYAPTPDYVPEQGNIEFGGAHTW